MNRYYIVVLVIGMNLLFTQCDKVSSLLDSPKEEVSEKPEEELRPEWNWKKYKRARELSLGTKTVSIQPKRSLELKSEGTGELTLLIDKEKVTVPKGFLWAQMDKDKLAKDKERLEIDEVSTLLSTEKRKEFERPERIKNAKKELEENRLKLTKMKKLMSSKTLLKNAQKIFPDIGKVNAKTLKEAEEEFAFSEKKLNRLQEIDEILEEGADRKQDMDLDKARESYDKAKDKSNYEAPFSGELRIELDWVEDQNEYTVAGRELLATLNDYEEMHVLLGTQGANWISLDSDSLVLRLNDRKSTEVTFKEDKTVKDERTRKEEKFYIFSAVTAEEPQLKRLAGTTIQADLLTKLEKRCWIVPKVDISMEALGQTESKVWRDIVDDVWPGANVVAVGGNSIAIDYIPQNAKYDNEELESLEAPEK